MNQAVVPARGLFHKNPPTFMAAETTDHMAAIGARGYQHVLTRQRASDSEIVKVPLHHPEAERYSILKVDNVEVHLWNSSGAHGTGLACVTNRMQQGWPLTTSHDAICDQWPYRVAQWMVGLGLVHPAVGLS